ncbi:MAG: glycosyltransferase family 4 protein [Rhodothermales bacterium]
MKPKLLFIYLHPSSFVREDLRILAEEYELVRFQAAGEARPGPLGLAALMVRQLFWLLREMPRARGVYGWFADYHMVLPVVVARLFRRPVAVAVGGFDAISLPSLRYGVVLSSWRWPLTRIVIRSADVLLPVSPSLVYSRNSYSEWPRETEQGIRALLPDTRTEIQVLPTGYDPDLWTLGPSDREDIVSTVGLFDSERTLRRKGLDVFFETARGMPDVQFRVIGVVDPSSVVARFDPPANVELIEPVERSALVDHYHETSVYLQLSRAEGLPNVLCEAMLCGCIPVGSRAFGIPDGVGDAGWVVEKPHAEDVSAAVRAALQAPAELREAARAHIEKEFHIDSRRRDLLAIMHHLTDRHGDVS